MEHELTSLQRLILTIAADNAADKRRPDHLRRPIVYEFDVLHAAFNFPFYWGKGRKQFNEHIQRLGEERYRQLRDSVKAEATGLIKLGLVTSTGPGVWELTEAGWRVLIAFGTVKSIPQTSNDTLLEVNELIPKLPKMPKPPRR